MFYFYFQKCNSGMNGFHAEGKWLQVQLKKGEEYHFFPDQIVF